MPEVTEKTLLVHDPETLLSKDFDKTALRFLLSDERTLSIKTFQNPEDVVSNIEDTRNAVLGVIFVVRGLEEDQVTPVVDIMRKVQDKIQTITTMLVTISDASMIDIGTLKSKNPELFKTEVASTQPNGFPFNTLAAILPLNN